MVSHGQRLRKQRKAGAPEGPAADLGVYAVAVFGAEMEATLLQEPSAVLRGRPSSR